MAYQFVRASTQYIIGTLGSGLEKPYTMACTAYLDSNGYAASIIGSVGESYSTLFNFSMIYEQTKLKAQSRGNTDSIDATASSSDSMSTKRSYAVCGVFASDSSTKAFLSAVGSESTTAIITSVNPTLLGIGVRNRGGTKDNPIDGKIADFAIWSAALTDAEIASLAKGFKPTRIRPQSLVFYAPLVRNLQDVRAGLALTNNNSATVADHPRVY